MKDKIVTLNGGLYYYIVDEIMHERRIFAFAVQIDPNREEFTNNCIIAEVKLKNRDVVFDNVNDEKLEEELGEIFASRQKK